MSPGSRRRNRRRLTTAATFLWLTLAATGGWAQSRGESTAADLKTVERAAARGDKRAQLELGVRYENGVGVTQDLKRARRFYELAAQTTTDRITVYSGPVGAEKYGRVITLGQPTITPGLPEAARRLALLNGAPTGRGDGPAAVAPSPTPPSPPKLRTPGQILSLSVANTPVKDLLRSASLTFDREATSPFSLIQPHGVTILGVTGSGQLKCPVDLPGCDPNISVYEFVSNIPPSRCITSREAGQYLEAAGWKRRQGYVAEPFAWTPPIVNADYEDGSGDMITFGAGSCITNLKIRFERARPTPASPPLGVTAPRLAPLPAERVAAVRATARHCLLTRGTDVIFAATETGRLAIVGGPNGVQALTLQFLGTPSTEPMRRGGRFAPSPETFDLWISIDPREDAALARGLPRKATLSVNGRNGGSDAFQASYTCNY